MLNSSNHWHIQPEAAIRFLPEIVNLMKGVSQPVIIENREDLGKLNFDLFVQKYFDNFKNLYLKKKINNLIFFFNDTKVNLIKKKYSLYY